MLVDIVLFIVGKLLRASGYVISFNSVLRYVGQCTYRNMVSKLGVLYSNHHA